jgi:hypothetical protein
VGDPTANPERQVDYRSVGNIAAADHPIPEWGTATATGTPSAFRAAAGSVFNGNIASMETGLLPLMASAQDAWLSAAFRYDQLNRIREARYFRTGNALTNAHAPGGVAVLPDWASNYAYDRNGNLRELNRLRKMPSGLLAEFDQMTYIFY